MCTTCKMTSTMTQVLHYLEQHTRQAKWLMPNMIGLSESGARTNHARKKTDLKNKQVGHDRSKQIFGDLRSTRSRLNFPGPMCYIPHASELQQRATITLKTRKTTQTLMMTTLCYRRSLRGLKKKEKKKWVLQGAICV